MHIRWHLCNTGDSREQFVPITDNKKEIDKSCIVNAYYLATLYVYGCPKTNSRGCNK